MEISEKKYKRLQQKLELVQQELEEARDTLEAIRLGQVDALMLESGNTHQLYTLKTADHAYRVFIEKMSEGAVTLNKDGVILYCNDAFAAMVDKPPKEVFGLMFATFITSASKEQYNLGFQKCWTEDCKIEIYLVQGEKFIPVRLSMITLHMTEGNYLSVIITDLSDQKKAQQLLEQHNEKLGEINKALEATNDELQQYASLASHDLQEPVRKIQIFAEFLHSDKANQLSHASRGFLEKITASAKRMKTLILDMLNYSKISANAGDFNDVDLNAVLNEVLEDLEFTISARAASIAADKLPRIRANGGQMRQIFQNLITNALKFSKEKPVIKIGARYLAEKSFDSKEQKGGNFVLLSFMDNGIGFDERYLENIFNLFVRLNPKDAYEGTGIGLSITKKLVEKHHGLMTAKSDGGQGSEFLIVLPVSQN